MKFWIALCLAVVLGADAAAQETQRVATVLGVSITRGELGKGLGDPDEPRRLLELVWEHLAPHYIDREGLGATPEELDELLVYERVFAEKDRAQRARKLVELAARLEDPKLAPRERAHLEEFHAVLSRLAARDEERDQAPPPAPEDEAALYAPWIEIWKLNQAIHARYGGVVALTRFGPDPHGARAALIADYEREGLLEFADPRLRGRVYDLLAARPSLVVPPEHVDFTPYWRKPVPASYFPD
jgi:hypothetical protein